jgi:hypothetical protein
MTNRLSASSLSKLPAELIGCTTAKHSRPPGSSTRALSRNASSKSSTSCSDMNAMTQSNAPSANGSAAASAVRLDLRIGLARGGEHRRRCVDADDVVAERLQVARQAAFAAQ